MHPREHDISSQQLAQREAAAVRRNAEPNQPGVDEEISRLQAKINMWRTQEQDAKDPVRAAYCKSRVKVLSDRLALLQTGNGAPGGGGQVPAEQLLTIEKKIIEGADIIVTTLASAQNHKMRGLRRRIALCIIDEAGQAIEPETLIPLTLDVTRLALIGDPQQLPGFICSQRAKKHGLGESLFYRLTSCAEQWGDASPVILLNQQYRMHADIADYPNRAFYNSRIQSFPQARPNIDIPPYSIVCISSGDKGQGEQYYKQAKDCA
ncbi:AAA domain-containing protein [Phthorimaea operculella]|nr:AAA domain-containing protein [Phthorimaea operculella]